MFLPIGDAPNPRTTPWVTYALLALNIAVYALVTLPLSGAPADLSDPLAQDYLRRLSAEVGRPLTPLEAASNVRAYDIFVLRYGFVPASPTLGTALTCLFLHAGFLHLAGNMLFLWIYGNNVEHRLGRLGYFAAYLGTGFAATAAHLAMDPASGIPTVGASGAISGVLGFYFVFFPRNSVRVAVLLLPFLARVFEIPARVVLGTYLVLDNLVPVLLEPAATSGVAYGAHIGGFLAGLAAGFAVDRRERTATPREYRRVPRPTDSITEGGAAVSARLRRRANGRGRCDHSRAPRACRGPSRARSSRGGPGSLPTHRSEIPARRIRCSSPPRYCGARAKYAEPQTVFVPALDRRSSRFSPERLVQGGPNQAARDRAGVPSAVE